METTKYPLTDGCIKKIWYIYTMKQYFTIKEKEIRPFAAKCMGLEIIILTEVSHHMISLMCGN